MYLCGEGSYQRLFFRHFGAESHDPNAPIMCVRELISRSLYSGRLNLVQESLMIHNPFTVSCFREIQEDLSTSSQSQDPYSHFRGSLQCHCVDHNVYNETTCKEAYSTLPECPEALDYALESENSTPKHRFAAIELCAKVGKGNTNGIALKDIRLKVNFMTCPYLENLTGFAVPT